jgi:hypothetical protein
VRIRRSRLAGGRRMYRRTLKKMNSMAVPFRLSG